MRKFVVGLIIGAGIATAFNASAAVESLIGKQIDGQFPIKIEGKQLEQQAAVIEGTSYLPVRAIGDALNMDVSFNADLGIELKKKEEVSKVEETKQADPVQTKRPITLEEIENKIIDAQVSIKGLQMAIAGRIKMSQEVPPGHYEQLAKYEAELAELEAQKAELQSK